MSNDFLKSMLLLGALSSNSKTKKKIKRENEIRKQIDENNRKINDINDRYNYEHQKNLEEINNLNSEMIDSQSKTIDYYQELIDGYINLVKDVSENINDGIDLLESTKLHCDELKKREEFLKSLKKLINSFPSGSPESFNEYIDELNNYKVIYDEFVKEIEEYNAKVNNAEKSEK